MNQYKSNTLYVAVAPLCEHIGGDILTIYSDGEWEPYDEGKAINTSATKKVKCKTCGNIQLTNKGIVIQDLRTGELS